METGMTKLRIFLVGVFWICLIGLTAIGYRFFWAPKQIRQAEEEKIQQKEELVASTSSSSHYKDKIQINLDSFSGYPILRSDVFEKELASYNIGLTLKDDQADYDQRLQDLVNGDSQFAAFTVDGLIAASEKIKDIPGVIIFSIDESGADAAVGVQRVVDNVDALNDPATKFVLVPGTPSETFARVIMSYFDLNHLSDQPFEKVSSAKELYERYRRHKPTEKLIFVTWEPYVTKIAENPDYKVLVDSGKFRGYIVDVMVVSRSYLAKNPTIVDQVTRSYFKTLFHYRDKMSELLVEDSIKLKEPLKPEFAEELTKKIHWRNTRENYGHFGVVQGTGLQHIEDIISNITRVLLKTGGIQSDPTDGHPNQLYYDRILSQMHQSNFYPGGHQEEIHSIQKLVALSDEDWQRLEPVGTLELPQLVFARGTDRLTTASQHLLDELVKKLEDAPQFYLMVQGNAGMQGDLEANKVLALKRAESAKNYLVQKGMHQERIKAVGGEPSGNMTVNFVVGQLPF